MQPYYYPYAGYFRLFAVSDIFVFLDCVQWNRRGRVHRYESDGKWITLPIKKTDRDTTRIMDMQWQDGKEKNMSPVEFIIGSCVSVCRSLGIYPNLSRSCNYNINDYLHGQERILDICKKVGATTYINSPGGKSLYDVSMFSKHGVKLEFLSDYPNKKNIFDRLKNEKPEDIRSEIYANI